MKNILLFFIIFLTVIICSCHKDDDSKLIPLPTCLKNYGAFRPGSYWIYKNDSTLIQDSIYAWQWIPGRDASETDNHIDYYEELHVVLKSFLDSTADLSIDVNGHNPTVGYYYFNWSTGLDCRGMIPINNFYDSLLINNITYYSVNEYFQSNVPDTSSGINHNKFWSIKTYFQSERGLLKWEVVNADSTYESWSLVRSQVHLD